MRTYLWREEMPQTVRHTRQCHAPKEKNDQDDVWKRGGHVHDLKKTE